MIVDFKFKLLNWMESF